MPSLSRRFLLKSAALAASALFFAGAAAATEIKVMTSGGFTAAYKQLVPEYERTTGHTVASAYGASQGGAADSIPSRLNRGEDVDIVILAAPALEKLIAKGQVKAGSRVDLVDSKIGMSVRAGAPKPDISSVEALTRTLLDAKSIAYSASASGTYIANELYQKLGVVDQVKDKSQRIVSIRVGTVVARGDAEIGFQQVSELLPIAGIDFVGVLPPEVQKVTTFSAGIATHSKNPQAAQDLIRFFKSPAAAPIISKTGLEPLTTP